jgi:hypothetical protein
MFDRLPISPDLTFDNDGSEVFVAYCGGSQVLYVDGDLKHEGDVGRLRMLDHVPDGKISAYGEAELVYNAELIGEVRDPYNAGFPEDPADGIYSPQVSIVYIYNADQVQDRLDTDEARNSEYLTVFNRCEGMSNDVLKQLVPENVDIFMLE